MSANEHQNEAQSDTESTHLQAMMTAMMHHTQPVGVTAPLPSGATQGSFSSSTAVVDPPTPPPASFLPCRRIHQVEIYNPATGQTELGNDVIVLQQSLPPVQIGDGDDILMAVSATECNSPKLPKTTSAGDVKTGERAYWLRRTLREGKFGRIRYAVALRRRTGGGSGASTAEWELTDIKVAVKKYTLERLAELRGKIADDPIKGIAARQYMACRNAPPDEPFEARAQRAVNRLVESHVVTPIDVWVDHLHIYQIMPYCGAELFEVLDMNEHRFAEADARHWMGHILKALDFLHNTAGICHRDIRPENLLLHEESKALVLIDFGLCLLMPPGNEGTLIKPQGPCGTLPFIAPEIANNEAFDGRAVDLWQAAVILFVMVTGLPPWERPDSKDVRFNLVTGGHMEQMLRTNNLGLSPEVMDLLQSMLRLDPKQRLTLEQVRDHPWMKAQT